MLIRTTYTGEQHERIKERFLNLLGLKNLYDKGTLWPLPNMREIREVDYWWHRSSYSPKAELWTGQIKIADRDPHPKNIFGNPHWGHLHIYLEDHGRLEGGGHAILFTYNWMDWREDHPGSKDPNFHAVRYFTWQVCAHEFVEVGPVAQRSRGWHEYKCKKCGAGYTIDSGD